MSDVSIAYPRTQEKPNHQKDEINNLAALLRATLISSIYFCPEEPAGKIILCQQ